MDESYEFFYDYLSNGLFKVFVEIYNDSKKIKSPYNYLKNFQLALGETTKWSDVVYEKKWEFISKQSNCEYFDDYLKIIFYTKLKYLIENCIYHIKENENIDLSNYVPPSNLEFLKKVTIYTAREFYKNPYLFDDRNLSSKRIVKNRIIIKDTILKSIKYVIQLSLPTKLFINHYDPKELLRKVNDIQTRMSEYNSMNRTKYLTNNTDNTINDNPTMTVNNTIDKTNDPNSVIQLYQTMLLNQLMQQQNNLNQNISNLPVIQPQSPILKQTTISASSLSIEKDKSSDSEKTKNKKIKNNNKNHNDDSDHEHSEHSEHSNDNSDTSDNSDNSDNSENSDNSDSSDNDMNNRISNTKIQLKKQLKKEIKSNSYHKSYNSDSEYINEVSDNNTENNESEESEEEKEKNVTVAVNKETNLQKAHLNQLSKKIVVNDIDTEQLKNDTRLLMKKETIQTDNKTPEYVVKNTNTSVIKIKVDEEDLKSTNNFINENKPKPAENKKVNSSPNISINGLSSKTQKEMEKYTSKSYRNKLKSMNQNLKQKMSDGKDIDKIKSNLQNISKNTQKLNDDIVYVHKGDSNNKLQKRQLDIVRSITSQHTNFQSLSEQDDKFIEKKLNNKVSKVFLK